MKVLKLFCWFIIVSLAVIILTSCQSDVNPTNQSGSENANLPTDKPEPTQEPLPEPSETPLPTDTPAPTDSPLVDIHNVKLGNPRYLIDSQSFLNSISFSPDGDRVAFAEFGKIQILGMRSLNKVAVLEGHTDQIEGIVWTPDGNTMISAGLDGTVILWDTESYTKLSELQTGPVYSLDISPDGLEFVIGLESGIIQFWDVASNEMITSIESTTGSTVKSLNWSPNEGLVACGEESGDIHIIDANSHEINYTLSLDETTTNPTNSVAWSPDGKILASGHQNGQVFLWDVVNWELINTIEWNEGWVGDVTWLPNSLGLTISGEGFEVMLWDIDSGEYVLSANTVYSVFSAAWSPNGRILILASAFTSSGGIGYNLVFYIRIDT